MSRRLQKILLVYPEIPSDTYWSFKYALKFVKKKSAMPPVGLVTVAALMPESCQFKLVDMNIEPLLDEDIEWADAVFMSAMIVQKKSFEQVVNRCKEFNKTIVAGGPYVTVSHKEIKNVDHFLLGEVEDTLSIFIKEYENGTAKHIYPSLGVPDITHTVLPRFDLLDISAYASMAIQYSRGCPFDCEFCDVWQIYGRKPRMKSTENMIAELDKLEELKWRGAVFVVDDNFIGHASKVKNELLPAFTKWQEEHDRRFRFYTEASLNLAEDEKLLRGMRDAGFNSVFLGIETPSIDALEETGKLQNARISMPEAIQKIQAHGIEVMGGFIIGFDSDDEAIFESQINFIQKTGIPKAMVGLLNAVPGTKLYQRLSKEGRILSDSISGSNTHGLETNFITKMDLQMLKEGYRYLLNYLYGMNLKNYFARCNRLLDCLGDSPYFHRDVHFAEVCMLFKSLFTQTFSRYGYQYVKFVIRNLMKHRRFFGESIRMSIEGHHFYMITRETLKVDRLSSSLEDRYKMIVEKFNTFSTDSNRRIQALALLWNKKQKFLKHIRQQIRHVHADFREEIIQKYAEVDEKIRVIFRKYKKELMSYDLKIAQEI